MSAELKALAPRLSRQLPWNGIGYQVPENADLSAQELMSSSGCDWSVSKRPMFFSSAPKGGLDKSSNRNKVDDHYALVRDTDHALLDVVGNRYQPTQNKDAFDFFNKFTRECKLKMHSAGMLAGGQYVWAMAETPRRFSVAANDDLGLYILLLSPHKLGKSLIAVNTSIRFVCTNMINMALKNGKAAFRMTHARKFDEHAKDEAAHVLGLMDESFNRFGENAQLLAGAKASAENARQFFGAVFDMDDKMIDAEKQRKNSLLQRLLTAYDGGAPGAELPSAQGTYWGLLNSVTWVLDRYTEGSRDTNLKDNFIGWRGDRKRIALDVALKMAA